jgi:hypothetical protein
MNKVTKIILGLLGLSVIGIMTFYIVTKDKTSNSHKKAITKPKLDTVEMRM